MADARSDRVDRGPASGRGLAVLRLLAPLAVVVVASSRVASAAYRSASATLGRDQGIFQYVAWAAGRGDVLYRDVRDVNGPLVPLVHSVFQALGGEGEQRFRVLDLAASALAFGFVGACLPDLGDDDDPPSAAQRGAWAAAAIVALGAQYLAYGFWDTAQRESFFDWFVVAGIGAGLAGQRLLHRVARGAPDDGRAFAWLALSGAASAATVLGKPTYALFAFGQLVALAFDPMPIRLGRRVLPFVLGALVGLAVPAAFLLRRGDVAAWAHITFSDVPAMYRFIWPRPLHDLVMLPGYARTFALAGAATASVVGLVAVDVLPRRALALGLVPVFGLASVVAQAKGFPYHFHPVSAGTTLAFLAVVRAIGAPRGAARIGLPASVAAALGILGAVGLGVRARASLEPIPWPDAAAPLESEEHLAPFVRVDFFPVGLRRAARFLREHTKEDDRVQAYGMDPYLLFLARRLSATPYIYAYDLNVDAALAGASVFGGPRPSDAERARIQAMRDAHEADMLARLRESPPAAFVFHDRSPLLSSADALEDFEAHCPETAAWVRAHYREAEEEEGVHVWLRDAP